MDESVLTDDGVRLWARSEGEGDGDAVVICHGGPGLWDMSGALGAMLADGRRVIRWDQRGAGRSDPAGPFTIGRSVADLEAVRRHFGLRSMILFGHSWGAQLALCYALEHPGLVNALIYVSGTGIDPVDTWQRVHAGNRDRLLGRHAARWRALREQERSPAEEREYHVIGWSTDFADPDRGMVLAEGLADPWFGVGYACAAAIKDECSRTWGTPELRDACRAALGGVPTLIIDGARDPRPRSAVDSLGRALPAVSRLVLAGAAHWPWLEDADGFRAGCLEFLRRVPHR